MTWSVEVGAIDLATQTVPIHVYPPREYWAYQGREHPLDVAFRVICSKYLLNKWPVKWPNTSQKLLESELTLEIRKYIRAGLLWLLPPFDKLRDSGSFEVEIEVFDDGDEEPTKRISPSNRGPKPLSSLYSFIRNTEEMPPNLR